MYVRFNKHKGKYDHIGCGNATFYGVNCDNTSVNLSASIKK